MPPIQEVSAGCELRAIEAVVSRIRAFLPHSPAKEGPLRDLHRVRIVETIAESMRLGPALAAIRRVAGAVAVAAPLAFSPMLATPTMAASSGSGAAGAPVINVTQNITITGGDGTTISRELRAHARELAQIIEAELAKRGRTAF